MTRKYNGNSIASENKLSNENEFAPIPRFDCQCGDLKTINCTITLSIALIESVLFPAVTQKALNHAFTRNVLTKYQD